MANLVSFAILLVFLYGRSLRFTNLKWHIRLMLFAFVSDLILILALVVERQALSKISPSMSGALMIHVPIAVLTVAFYVATVWTGFQLYQGKAVRERLKLLDRILLPLRVLTLVTSVYVQISGL